MELPVIKYSKAEYIETDSGNKISRQSQIYGSQNIILGGKTIIAPETIIRGDLRRNVSGTTATIGASVAVAIGKYSYLGEKSVLRPPGKMYKGVFTYYPVKIGECVHIERNSVIEAASIGSYVHIGQNCTIGRFVIIKDCARILDGAVVPPHTVIPSFSVYGGNPARLVDELPECAMELYEARSKEFYNKWMAV